MTDNVDKSQESVQDVQDESVDSDFVIPFEKAMQQKDAVEAPIADKKADEEAAKEPSETADETPEKKETKEIARRDHAIVQARREARELREAQEELRAEINSLKQAKATPDLEAPKIPNPDDFEFGQYGDDYIAAQQKYLEDREAYILAKADENTRATVESMRSDAQRESQFSRLQERILEVGKLGLDKYSDFDQVVEDAFEAMRPDDPFVDALRNLTLRDGAEDVVYHLAKNPDVLEKITGMDSMAQAFEMGKIASQIAAKRNIAEKSISKAQPTPKTPRGSTGQFISSENALYDRMLKAYS